MQVSKGYPWFGFQTIPTRNKRAQQSRQEASSSWGLAWQTYRPISGIYRLSLSPNANNCNSSKAAVTRNYGSVSKPTPNNPAL
eukprot:1594151-Amphidinium_carterae.1